MRWHLTRIGTLSSASRSTPFGRARLRSNRPSLGQWEPHCQSIACSPRAERQKQIPISYRLNTDGTYTLYSVGKDGRDDNGDPTKDEVWPIMVPWEK